MLLDGYRFRQIRETLIIGQGGCEIEILIWDLSRQFRLKQARSTCKKPGIVLNILK